MNDSELSARIEALYGNTDWAGTTGILHVAAVGGEPLCAIAIGPQAPHNYRVVFGNEVDQARAAQTLNCRSWCISFWTGKLRRAELLPNRGPDIEACVGTGNDFANVLERGPGLDIDARMGCDKN